MKTSIYFWGLLCILAIGAGIVLLSRYFIRRIKSFVTESREADVAALASLRQEFTAHTQAFSVQLHDLGRRVNALNECTVSLTAQIQAVAQYKQSEAAMRTNDDRDSDDIVSHDDDYAIQDEEDNEQLYIARQLLPITPELPTDPSHGDHFGQLALLVANGAAAQYREAFQGLTQCRVRVSNYERVANNVTDRVYFTEAPDGEYTMSKNMELVPCPEIFNGYSDSSMVGGVWLLRYVFPETQEGVVTEIRCALLEKPNARGPYVLKTPGKLMV